MSCYTPVLCNCHLTSHLQANSFFKVKAYYAPFARGLTPRQNILFGGGGFFNETKKMGNELAEVETRERRLFFSRLP